MSAEITKVTLKLGKREIEMTVEEARNLKAALENLFGKDVVREVVRDGCNHWHWNPLTPIYTPPNGTGNPPWPYPYEITCQADGGGVGSNLCLNVS